MNRKSSAGCCFEPGITRWAVDNQSQAQLPVEINRLFVVLTWNGDLVKVHTNLRVSPAIAATIHKVSGADGAIAIIDDARTMTNVIRRPLQR